MIRESQSLSWKDSFINQYREVLNGFVLNSEIIVDDVRVRGERGGYQSSIIDDSPENIECIPLPIFSSMVYFKGGRISTPIYQLDDLSVGSIIKGPALIIQSTATIVIEPNCTAIVTETHLKILIEKESNVPAENDPVTLSIFAHRFMSIAEQMGTTLQKTATSTNIKERLDLSCAIFDQEGGLVANAPHIPVHLGSMQEAVKSQIGNFNQGDIIFSNHPKRGGSHLPDITVITPVFRNDLIVFFVASRGHHGDIGGISSGSTPPSSKYLWQEGAMIKSFKIVSNGVFDEAGIRKLLVDDPQKFPNCSGARCINDNISDLKAQIAANTRGVKLLNELANEFGLDCMQLNMRNIQLNAEETVRSLLVNVSNKIGRVLTAHDFMDDGTRIQWSITIDKDGSAIFDFSG